MSVTELKPKTLEQKLRQCRIDLITLSLFQAANGKEVLEALKNVPRENLKAMGDMIEHILSHSE